MSRPQLLTIGIIIFAAVLLLVGLFLGRKPSSPQPASLEIWGVEDEADPWKEIAENFRGTHPEITVNYRRFAKEGYEETLVNRLAEGRGPDIFYLKNSWIVKHRDKITPLPQRTFRFSIKELDEQFADIAAEDLITDKGDIMGLPLYVDTLALYYNKDIFNAAGIASPPRDWEEVSEVSRTLTKTAPAGGILRSGIALGTSRNVEHALEIISALSLQENGEIISGAGAALERYTSFANPRNRNYSWNSRLPNSLDAFAEGTAAMAIGFAADQKRIAAKNPHLNFGVTPFPQIRGAQKSLAYGGYFFPAVSKSSRSAQAAWQFLLFASSRQGAKIYLEKTGRPPARRDLIALKGAVPAAELFAKQALVAKSWPIPDEQAVRRLFEEAVESAVSGFETPNQAARKLGDKLKLLLP